jgi:DNA repair photolyase
VEDFWDGSYYDAEFLTNSNETTYTDIYPKTIVNKVDSPEIPSDWSMNPYQGCEHGCIYCYARITHEYWGYSAGTQFEKNILIKKDAPLLLAKKLQSKSWKGEPIMLSGNTDCYQPAELKFGITRQLLEVCLKHNQPVGIITKNALVCRDLDLLKQLAEKNLVQVHLSITTLDETLRRAMEPRTSSGANRLKTIKLLQQNGIPVHVMMAPIIPGLNSDEVFTMCEAVSKAGATSLNHTMVRLNGAIALLYGTGARWVRSLFYNLADSMAWPLISTAAQSSSPPAATCRPVASRTLIPRIYPQLMEMRACGSGSRALWTLVPIGRPPLAQWRRTCEEGIFTHS